MELSGSGGEQFRGFLVQARTILDGSPVGVFTDTGGDQKLSACSPSEVQHIPHFYHVFYNYLNCECNLQSAVTHTSSNLKSGVSLTWTAPPEGIGEIEFL